MDAAPSTVRSRDVLLRLRRNPGALVGLGIVGVIVFVALFAPLIAPEHPSGQAYLDRLGGHCCPGPSADHWFGLDELGRGDCSPASSTALGSRWSSHRLGQPSPSSPGG